MHDKVYAFEQQNSFTRINLSDAAIQVRNFNRDGHALGEEVELPLR